MYYNLSHKKNFFTFLFSRYHISALKWLKSHQVCTYVYYAWGFKSTIVYFKGPHYCNFEVTRGSKNSIRLIWGLYFIWFIIFAKLMHYWSSIVDLTHPILHTQILLMPLHTVSFDWFLSGLEWIINLEFCLLKLLIFYQKLLWNIRSRLDSSTFWVFEPLFLVQ